MPHNVPRSARAWRRGVLWLAPLVLLLMGATKFERTFPRPFRQYPAVEYYDFPLPRTTIGRPNGRSRA